MKAVLINRGSDRMPKAFIEEWIRKLSEQKPFAHVKKELVVVFVDAKEMKALNKQYRGRNYATDVLSFDSVEDGVLGELVLCVDILKKQAIDTKLTFQHELGYMIIHGALHLLGFDHEKSKAEEKKMFALQDKIFAALIY